MPMNQGKGWTFNTTADTYEKIRPGYQRNDDTEQVRTASGQIMNLLIERFTFQVRLTDLVEPFPVNDILAACGDNHASSSFSVDPGVRGKPSR